MATFFRELWTDPAKFRGVLRGVLVVIGQLIALGVMDLHLLGLSPEQAKTLGAAITGGAVMVPSRTNHTPQAPP